MMDDVCVMGDKIENEFLNLQNKLVGRCRDVSIATVDASEGDGASAEVAEASVLVKIGRCADVE